MKRSIETLKSFFKTGEIPTQDQYEDVLDSLLHMDTMSEGITTGYEPMQQQFTFNVNFPPSFEFLNQQTAINGRNLEVFKVTEGYIATINASMSPITMSVVRDIEVSTISSPVYVEYVVTKFFADMGPIIKKYIINIELITR